MARLVRLEDWVRVTVGGDGRVGVSGSGGKGGKGCVRLAWWVRVVAR